MKGAAIMCCAILQAAACRQGAQQPAQQREAPRAAASATAQALAKAADQALAESLRLDYRRPEGDEPLRRDNVRKAYLDACQAGDHRSCRIAPAVRDHGATHPVLPETQALVRDECQAGDMMSCRALPDGPGLVQRRAGAADGSTESQLRMECEQGFPASCRKAMDAKPPDAWTLAATASRLEREGCQAGVLAECEALYAFAGEALSGSLRGGEVDEVQVKIDMALSGSMLCTVKLECDGLWLAYEHTDPEKSRDEAERSCQLTQSARQRWDACSTLVDRYRNEELNRRWREPQPGRAQALQAWLDKHPRGKD